MILKDLLKMVNDDTHITIRQNEETVFEGILRLMSCEWREFVENLDIINNSFTEDGLDITIQNVGVYGYKAFRDCDGNLVCRDMVYEVGKTYEMSEKPKLCERGYHFCKTIADTYNYYSFGERICKVLAIGDIDDDGGDKLCTNKIVILEEITDENVKKCNANNTSSGYLNSGDYNSGHYNSGNYNSGNYNSGYRNSGDYNSGHYNSGNYNSGNYNSGYYNSGYRNSGDYNSGYRNNGHYNSGNYNSGYYNSGNYNSGDYNSGHYNSGCFNTDEPMLRLFNKESTWKYNDWLNSDARYILSYMPYEYSNFINKSNMTDEEKEQHPEYKTTGGFVKVFTCTNEDRQNWWNQLSENKKETVKSLPNFDSEIFKECTGIDVNM